MSYYELLNLKKEPFSTSPDPEFFYLSNEHNTALKRLEISIRLRRGLSVILGDVGTGKTTLSRILMQSFSQEDNFVFHMVLDPAYKSEFQFLHSLISMFGIKPDFRSTLDYREAIERFLFQKGVDENRTIVLVIDEGQKLSPAFLEILRTLLNYETNEYKLLQLVILGQMELLPKIQKTKNFLDRITLKYVINPLDEEETRGMVEFRLKQAGYDAPAPLFTESAIKVLHSKTMGYPRQITILCHNALERLVMQDKRIIGEELVGEVVEQEVF